MFIRCIGSGSSGNSYALYDDNNNKEFTLFFERVSDSFDFSCFI